MPEKFTPAWEQPHAVYQCFDQNGQVIYVGMGISGDNRLANHGTATWWPEVVRWETTSYPNRSVAYSVETDLIRSIQPKYNISQNVDGGDRSSGVGLKRLKKATTEEEKRVPMSVRLDARVHAALSEDSRRTGYSMGALLNAILVDWLDTRGYNMSNSLPAANNLASVQGFEQPRTPPWRSESTHLNAIEEAILKLQGGD